MHYSRLSIVVLFESAADAFKNKLIGFVYTGANKDGAAGLKTIKENNGLTIVQDPTDAVVAIMPEADIATAEVDQILPLAEISNFLNSFYKRDFFLY